MRSLIFLSFILSFVLIGCTDDDNKEISNIEKVILNISYDTDGDSPSGEACIYFIENINIEDIEPNFMSMSLKGTEGKMVHPIKTIYFDKNSQNKVQLVINWSELPDLVPYGFPKEGKYVIAIKLDAELMAAKRITSKIFNIQNDLTIDKVFKREGAFGKYKYEEW